MGKKRKKKRKRCNQCYKQKPKEDGYPDDDGVWYCNECWREFDGDAVEDVATSPNGQKIHIRSSSDPKGRRAGSLTDDMADLLLKRDLFKKENEHSDKTSNALKEETNEETRRRGGSGIQCGR